MEAHDEEQREAQHGTTDGGEPGEEPEGEAEADGDLTEGDDDAEEGGVLERVADEAADWARPHRTSDLGLDADGTVGIEEVGVGQLLNAGKEEAERQEGTEREQRPSRDQP